MEKSAEKLSGDVGTIKLSRKGFLYITTVLVSSRNVAAFPSPQPTFSLLT